MKLRIILKNMGIENEEKISFDRKEKLCKTVSKKISSTFNKYGIKYEDIYLKLINTEMYFADIGPKSDKVSYIYKNASIYIDRSINIDKITDELLRGMIHKIQENRNNRNQIKTIGLFDLNNPIMNGIGLNEAAIEYCIHLLLYTKKEKINAYGINVDSLSRLYPTLTNIVEQITFIVGEEVLIKSLLYGNSDFKKAFIKECSREKYYEIVRNMDCIYKTKNKIISENRLILFKTKLKEEQKAKIRENIDKNETKIQSLYIKVQNLMSMYYFNKKLENAQETVELEVLKSKVGKYRKIIGNSVIEKENTFDKYSLDLYYKIEERAEQINTKALIIPKKKFLYDIKKSIQKLYTSNMEKISNFSNNINKQN